MKPLPEPTINIHATVPITVLGDLAAYAQRTGILKHPSFSVFTRTFLTQLRDVLAYEGHLTPMSSAEAYQTLIDLGYSSSQLATVPQSHRSQLLDDLSTFNTLTKETPQ